MPPGLSQLDDDVERWLGQQCVVVVHFLLAARDILSRAVRVHPNILRVFLLVFSKLR